MQMTTATDITTVTTAASTTVVASYDLSEVGIMVGIVFTMLSFCTSLFFHIRRERREVNEAMHKGRVWRASKDRALRQAQRRDKTEGA